MAEFLGVSPGTVGGWETKLSTPNFGELDRIAAKLGINTGYLLGFVDSIVIPEKDTAAQPHTPAGLAPESLDQKGFRDLVDGIAVECHRRGHRLAARVLMDLVDELDQSISSAADVADAVASIALAEQAAGARRPGLPPKRSTGATSAHRPAPSAGASSGSKAQPVPPAKVQE